MPSLSGFLLNQFARLPYSIGLWSRFPLGSVKTRVDYGVFDYPHYAFGVYWAAVLASRLKMPRISVLEFGVAGGRGLVALERASSEIESALGVGIDVFGFDSGKGMPPARDYRDLPHIWGEGFYQMDIAQLQAQLQRARLVIGDVQDTVPAWIAERHAPLGFVAFDLDYYSSTVEALRIFHGDAATHLPRVHCFFDDLASTELGCMNTFVGEWLAIGEFNAGFANRKIARIEQVRLNRTRWEIWQDRMFAFHNFEHPRYTDLVMPRDASAQIPLRP